MHVHASQKNFRSGKEKETDFHAWLVLNDWSNTFSPCFCCCKFGFLHHIGISPPFADVTCNGRSSRPTRFCATSVTPFDETPTDLITKLENDLDTLTKLRPPQPGADPSIPQALVSAGSSYTRLWTHQTWEIHSDPPHKRYFRHLRRWHRSTTARKILPVVLMATFWSIFVSQLAKQLQLRPLQSAIAMAGTSSAVSLLSAPLALLLTLRANASMARIIEARQAWGRLVSRTGKLLC